MIVILAFNAISGRMERSNSDQEVVADDDLAREIVALLDLSICRGLGGAGALVSLDRTAFDRPCAHDPDARHWLMSSPESAPACRSSWRAETGALARPIRDQRSGNGERPDPW
jgi:hypothetical protein